MRVASDYRRLIDVAPAEAEQAITDAVEFQRMALDFLATQGFVHKRED